MEKFVILSRGRCGSYLLVSLLNNSPDVYCYGEILNKQYLVGAFDSNLSQYSPDWKDNHELFTHEHAYNAWKNQQIYVTWKSIFFPNKERLDRTKMIGAKILNYQLNEKGYSDVYENMNPNKIILLHRKNILRVCLSDYVAIEQENYTNIHGNQNEIKPINVDISKLKDIRSLTSISSQLPTNVLLKIRSNLPSDLQYSIKKFFKK